MNYSPLVVLILFVLINLGCKKEPNHSVRINNSLKIRITNVWFGKTHFNNLNPNQYSEYKKIEPGDYKLSCVIGVEQKVSDDKVPIKGDGNHKWIVTVISPTLISLQESK